MMQLIPTLYLYMTIITICFENVIIMDSKIFHRNPVCYEKAIKFLDAERPFWEINIEDTCDVLGGL